MFYVCTAQYSSHWLCVATEHLKGELAQGRAEVFILFYSILTYLNLDLKSHTPGGQWLHWWAAQDANPFSSREETEARAAL